MRLDRVQEFAVAELEDELAGETAPAQQAAVASDQVPVTEPEVDYIDGEVIETDAGDQVDTATGEVVAEAQATVTINNQETTELSNADSHAASEAPVEAAKLSPAVQAAVDLAKKLQKEHGVEAEALAMQFLPEGVGLFSKLSEEQAQQAIPGLAELLNSKIKAAKA